MTEKTGRVANVNGNLVSVEFDGNVSMNEICFVKVKDIALKSEVIRIRGNVAQIQVYEMTDGIKCGDQVEFTGEMLSVDLGPGLLGQIYDGLQNPLPELARQAGWFLERGIYADGLDGEKKWEFTPTAQVGAILRAGEHIGTVPEGPFTHKIFIPFYLLGSYTLKSIAEKGEYAINEPIAVITDERGRDIPVSMTFKWPVKRAIKCYSERLAPVETMETKVRLIDSFFPVAKGGTYCTPGPFGAGKTVLQHTTSKYADVDIVIIAACGERAGEVVETLTEFPELTDPKTGRSLMERTIIICNTSSMPVASREASVYTSVTLAEYYRQMGLNVLLLADS
ncbi:MAG: V-type ATP synthase subunit A, partial [Christensenellaceae bacterium]|nr:V-type ATP synthase subunit A [Christensenellaceae bacterium]